MLRPRFAFAFSALAVLLGCSDDPTPTRTNNLAFDGVTWVAPNETGKLVVTWKPVTGATEYRVYTSRVKGRQLSGITPAAKTQATAIIVEPDIFEETYFVSVRAVDASGAEDVNTAFREIRATPDKTPPTFTGPRLVDPAGSAGARVTWDPASDPGGTPAEAIVYDVYAGRSRQTIRKVATTGPGETTITLNQLGSPSETILFAVRARDIAGNESGETQPVSSALGQDATPPTFAGCDTATSLSPTTAEVTWSPATDNYSPASSLTYDVYLSTTSKAQDLGASTVKVVAGTSAKLSGLQPGATYFVTCKAHDVAGNIDANTIERSFTTAGDVTKPVFAGITGFTFDPVFRSVELKWSPGADNETPPNALIYDVFESVVPGKYDFTAPPRASSAPGAKSIIIIDVASRSALNWVVRARDATGNRDENLVERSGTTLTSYSVDVQGVFNRNCAVVGCHVTGPQTGGLNLSPAFSYASLYDFPSNQNRPSVRVSKDKDLQASWLYLKITDPAGKGGLLMPAPQTGNALGVVDKDIITSWILQGALNN